MNFIDAEMMFPSCSMSLRTFYHFHCDSSTMWNWVFAIAWKRVRTGRFASLPTKEEKKRERLKKKGCVTLAYQWQFSLVGWWFSFLVHQCLMFHWKCWAWCWSIFHLHVQRNVCVCNVPLNGHWWLLEHDD